MVQNGQKLEGFFTKNNLFFHDFWQKNYVILQDVSVVETIVW